MTAAFLLVEFLRIDCLLVLKRKICTIVFNQNVFDCNLCAILTLAFICSLHKRHYFNGFFERYRRFSCLEEFTISRTSGA